MHIYTFFLEYFFNNYIKILRAIIRQENPVVLGCVHKYKANKVFQPSFLCNRLLRGVSFRAESVLISETLIFYLSHSLYEREFGQLHVLVCIVNRN